MKMTNGSLTACLLLMLAVNVCLSQNNKELALEKGKAAVALMDEGKFKESIQLLEEAEKLDPTRFDYPYEKAYAHYAQEDYKGAIKILEKITGYKDVTERLYQMLGNSYDALGQTEKAFDAYDRGLKIFPKSGMIHLEKGNVHWGKEEFEKALSYYEKGIEVDPAFPSNYYRAAKLYCGSTEEVWGMIYGEIFMNLERNSERTSEMSKLLYDTYKSEIKFTSDTSFSVSFSKNAVITIDDLKNSGKLKLPFGVGVYEPTLMVSMLSEKEININSLSNIRSEFVDNYFKGKHDKSFPNVLFSYQKQVKEAGHMEAYNHWILMKGDESAFDKWHFANAGKWDKFIKWFTDNGLEVTEKNKFYTAQY